MSYSYQMMMGAGGGADDNELQQQQNAPQYTMPKILDYLQSEWFKYEIDRAHWVSEKSDLMATITRLEAEKKTQEQLRNDLFRRIKMLEYALQQERAKNQPNILNSNSNNNNNIEKDVNDHITTTTTTTTTTSSSQPRSYGKKSSKVSITRNLIKKYLREMNYNDILVSKPDLNSYDVAAVDNDNIQDDKQTTILNLPELKKQQHQQQQQQSNNNSQQLQQQLQQQLNNNSNNNSNNNDSQYSMTSSINDLESSSIQQQPNQQQQQQQQVYPDQLLTSSMGEGYSLSDLTNSLDSLSSALGSLDSLSNGGSAGGTFDFSTLDNLDSLKENIDQQQQQSSINNNGNDLTSSVIDLSHHENGGSSSSFNTVVSQNNRQTTATTTTPPDEPSYDESAFNEEFFNKLSSNSKGRMKLKGLTNLKSSMSDDSGTSSIGRSGISSSKTGATNRSSSSSITPVGSLGKKKGLAAELMGLGAGDLNDIKLEDNSKIASDSAAPRVWRYKHTLKSHFDGVRSLQFHDTEPLLISASEDSTIKLWNLNQLAPSSNTSKKSTGDVEPIYTFRGHTGPVYTTALSSDSSKLYSAGYDMVIKSWTIPSADTDPYHTHGDLQAFLDCEYAGHTDGVWDLLAATNDRLISASADATVRIWDDNGNEIGQFQHPTDSTCIPTTLSLIPTDYNRILIGYVDGTVLLYDLSTGQHISTLSSNNNSSDSRNHQINKVVSHSMLPLAITGTEDNKIEFWDLQSCQPIHSMVAHSDAVSSLTIDPSGLYIASSSHDSTIRFWDISSKTCIQDLQSHRPKFDESIHSIKYHPTKGYFASGGADSVIRIHQ
ncbi:WD40 repeat-containing protein [Heterostelium album PN500]|uniref:WD40 repeat-containing protein n=1 Tax=Heterostelium pallidum (strain ATCC 26659 / Pp 5 / PN500) TaxID=670386 RepID=D3BCQ2_HETP5|nr:WD40 repeat-containing protein [Heterostelium album PN500]EFA80694.1 WD40 repeat-containing protein [Heterostelium album PN500]|eukprot:XP_020432814.1 WD40 repeat-containing protein [Heterostelium album PN500]